MENKKKIYTVATSHLDTIWSWDFEKTTSTYIYNTLVDNFKLFEKYPNYTFSFEGSYRYELMEEYYPELFEKVKDYVKKGRWNVCGSAFENGDTNIPSPEALFRNILFGNSYFDKTFGKRSVDIYLPDCFGFGFALPSIARHSNLLGFTTQKLAWGCAFGVPFDIGKWFGVDGDFVYASCNPHAYYYTLTKLRDWDFVTDKLKENEKYDLPFTYIFHGIGDRGGAPDEKSVQFVEEEIKKNDSSNIEVLASSADQVYHDIVSNLSDAQKEKLPTWKTELVMQNHGVGGYTSRAVGKRWNRRCEELADMAERSNVVASYFGDKIYPQSSINRSWKRFIAHQFHDDMPGTSVERAYRRSWNDYAMSMNQFSSEIESGVGAFSAHLKTDFCTGKPVVVSNTIECDRHEVVSLCLKNVCKQFVRVFDEKGKEVKSQTNTNLNGDTEVLFVADVKSLGFRVYDLRESADPCPVKSEISISTENVMENQNYVVELNRKGNITSIIDKNQDNLELLKEPITIRLYKYTGSKVWPAWEMNFKEQNKEADRSPNVVSISIAESGPARVAFKVIQKDKESLFTNYIALSDGGKIVEVYSEIEWRSLRTLAKNKFSFKASNKVATFDLGFGAIERENANEKLFEVPAQKWVDLTDESGEFGVSVISECKYGWDKFKDNTLRMTVLHTPKRNYRIDSMQSMMDLGLNRYSYAIFSHSRTDLSATQLEARKFIQPMAVVLTDKHCGNISNEYSFGNISNNSVIVRAIKKAEDTNEIVVRFNEGANKSVSDVSFTLGFGIKSAREIFASEEDNKKGDSKFDVKDGKLVMDFKPYEVRSFALTLNDNSKKFDCPIFENVDLPYDLNIITSNNNRSDADFDITIPKELVNEKFYTCGVEFNISKSNKNVLKANGQSIDVKKDAQKLYILCASLNGDKEEEFDIDDEIVSKKIYSIFENFAQWDLYHLKDMAYIKDGKLGVEFTHSHSKDADLYAKGMYFYIVELDVKSKRKVILPVDSDIVILSAAFAKNVQNSQLLTKLYDEVPKREYDFGLSIVDYLKYLHCRQFYMLHDKDGFIKDKNKGMKK